MTRREAAIADEGRAILLNALGVGAELMTDCGTPAYDPHLDAERVLLAAAAVLIARRAARTRASIEALVAEQQLFLEARAEDARARAMRGARP